MADDRQHRVRAAVARAWAEGCPVARDIDRVAGIALRRWKSAPRRGIRDGSTERLRADVAKGLIRALEPDPQLVGPLARDYAYLAEMIVEALREE